MNTSETKNNPSVPTKSFKLVDVTGASRFEEIKPKAETPKAVEPAPIKPPFAETLELVNPTGASSFRKVSVRPGTLKNS